MSRLAPTRVLAAYTAQYADPIQLRAGEAFHLTGREDLWRGHRWWWGVAADGREGWVPAGRVERHGAAGLCRREYSAQELSVRAGEAVTVLEVDSGWGWCVNADGAGGWVPLENLAQPPDGADPATIL